MQVACLLIVTFYGFLQAHELYTPEACQERKLAGIPCDDNECRMKCSYYNMRPCAEDNCLPEPTLLFRLRTNDDDHMHHVRPTVTELQRNVEPRADGDGHIHHFRPTVTEPQRYIQTRADDDGHTRHFRPTVTELQTNTQTRADDDDHMQHVRPTVTQPQTNQQPYKQQTESSPQTTEVCVNTTDDYPKNQILILALNELQNCSDEDVVQVKSWILAYKHLAPEQKMYTRKAVQTVLFEGLSGQLNKTSIKINAIPSQCLHMTNTSSHLMWVYYEEESQPSNDNSMPCEMVCKSKHTWSTMSQ